MAVRIGYGPDERRLRDLVALIVAKSIQVAHIQQVLKRNAVDAVWDHSDECTPNIIAKSFYREMIKTGFDFPCIIKAISGIISELNDDLRIGKRL